MTNRQLNFENIHRVENLTYESLEKKYINVQVVGTVLTYIGMMLLVLFILLVEKLSYRTFIVAGMEGLFFPTIVTIPLCKVQQVSIQQNPISKIFGLYSIAIVNGAQFEAETVIPGLTKARADEMKTIIMEYIQHGTI